MEYGIKKMVPLSYEDAIEKVKNELGKQEFGILTEIDVKATLKKKIQVDFDKYTILGACNPSLAYKSLQNEQDIGLLLPCNVIVYEKDGKTFVNAIDPVVAMGFIENVEVNTVAKDVRERLLNVIHSL
jgi:uncharacterized protein (DUF302 family)